MYLLCISYSFIYMLHSRYTCYIRIFRLSSVLEVEITEVLEMSLSLVIASVPVALPMVMKVTLSIHWSQGAGNPTPPGCIPEKNGIELDGL